MCRLEALSFFAKSVAALELLPYHSASFGLPARIMNDLHSVCLARSYVSEVLVPRARRGGALLIAARQAGTWGLAEEEHTIVYKGSETRAAYFTPDSRGGKAILRHLKAKWLTER